MLHVFKNRGRRLSPSGFATAVLGVIATAGWTVAVHAGTIATVALTETASPIAGADYRAVKLPNVGDAPSFPVAFRAFIKGPSVKKRGLMAAASSSSGALLVEKGQVTPLGTGLYRTFSRPSVDASGTVIWLSRASGVGRGVFQHDGVSDDVVFVQGTGVPSGGTLNKISLPSICGAGGVVAHATVSGGPITEGIFQCAGGDGNCTGGGTGTLSELVVEGDPVADRPGRAFCSFETGVRCSSWGIAFRASTKINCSDTGEVALSGVFRMAFGGSVETLALEGEAANSVGSLTSPSYDSFRDPPGIESTGNVVFRARVTASNGNEEGLYECDPAASCPGTPAGARFANGYADSFVPPNTVARIASPDIDDSGRIVFYASARDHGLGRSVYKLEPGATQPDLVAYEGATISDLPGAEIRRPFVPHVSPAGKIAFRARVRNAAGKMGVFLWQ
ncbi:MAG: hypothetical protein D6815_01895 [Candidatus Dadabacteria bacterium]|nr:MAG: hypothetical protein D6815_01895 [Candidatus Dadabacteria bacterium]